MTPPYPACLEVRFTVTPDVVHIHARGDIDDASAVAFYRALRRALDTDPPRPVTVDLTAVTFFSSAGADALLLARRSNEHRLSVVGAARSVRRVLQILALEPL
jgi:anti-anti-sigma factor